MYIIVNIGTDTDADIDMYMHKKLPAIIANLGTDADIFTTYVQMYVY